MEKYLDLVFNKVKEKSYSESELILELILKIEPENAQAIQLMGVVQNLLGNFDKSIEYLDKVLELSPDNIEVYNNIALCYFGQGKFEKAIETINKAIIIDPKCSTLYTNLGIQYRCIQDLDNAIKYFKKSLEIIEDASVYTMLGGCYGEEKKLDLAEKCFKNAIKIDPNFAGAHTDLAAVYQLKGEYKKAWIEHEWRYKAYEQLKHWQENLDPNKKWTGQSLKNKKILIYTEQGSGDAILFFRYLKLIDGYIILYCNKDLEPLFKNYVNETKIKENIVEHDYHCSLLSLPYVFNNPSIPKCPYLFTEKIELDKNYLNIGICWQGNPKQANDKARSCDFNYFKSIGEIPNVKLYSLMKEDLGFDSFLDTAKLINSLDLIISVDTAVLHLAGALNKPTFGLLSWNSYWVWGLTRENTHWYKSVKLFRQKSKGNWKEVFEEVEREVRQYQY